MQKISENEVRTDLLHVRDQIPSKSEKIEIGMKYGLPKAKCTRVENVITKIYEYLRELRKAKDTYTENDLRDFYNLTKAESRYEKLEPYLMLESGKFVKYLLDYVYSKTQNRSWPQDIKDNIDTINIKSRQWYFLSSNDKNLIERYLTIKRYWETNYGLKACELQNVNKNKYELETKLIEDTYEIRLMLEEYLSDFINDCYDRYIYGSDEWKQLIDLLNLYTKLRDDAHGGHYPFVSGTDIQYDALHKYNTYLDALHFILIIYTYFNQKNGSKITKDKRIELSIDYFNKDFNKLIYKNITRTLLGKDITANDIEIKGLEKADFGYYFTIDYKDNKKLYINFILHHLDLDTSDMDKLCNKDFMYKNLYPTVCYIMSVTTKPYKEKRWLNESFDFNNTANLSLDNFDETDNEIQSQTHGKIKNKNYTKNYLAITENFVDMGLPSGTLWGKYNIGVDKNKLFNKQDWIGNYYAWGEVETKDVYNWKNYKYSYNNALKKREFETKFNHRLVEPFMSKYCGDKDYGILDCKAILDDEDDIAYVNNPNKGIYTQYMPTKGQCEELKDNCYINFANNYNGIKKLNGVLFTSKINGNELFFPFTGFKSLSKKVNGLNAYALIYTANNNWMSFPARAFVMDCMNYNGHPEAVIRECRRDFGCNIRPVVKISDIKESFDFNKINLTLDNFDFNDNLQRQTHGTIKNNIYTKEYLKWRELIDKFNDNFTKIMSNINCQDMKGVLKAYIKEDCNLTKEDLQEIALLSKMLGIKQSIEKDLNLIIKFVSEIDPKCDLNWLDVSKITDMRNVFLYTNFNGNISEWNVSNVKTMNFMFAYSKFNGDISKWDISNVNSTYAMFFNSKFNKDISNWNISNIKNMAAMFQSSIFNKPLDKWDVSKVEDMSKIFEYSKYSLNISNWNINNKCLTFNAFSNCPIPKENIPIKILKWFDYLF